MSPNVRTALNVEYVLLGLIREGVDHGYEIYQQLRRPSGLGLIWRVKQSRLYALLDKLESEGLLESRVSHQASRPARKTYHLTQAGEAAWDAWVGEPVQHPRDARQQLLAKLYFLRETEAALQLLQKQSEVSSGWLLALRGVDRPGRPADRFDSMVRSYRLREVEGLASWLGQQMERLRKEATEVQGG